MSNNPAKQIAAEVAEMAGFFRIAR